MNIRKNSGNSDKKMIPRELRLGFIAELFFERILKKSRPRQIDLLDFFFPGLIVEEFTPADGKKAPAYYQDTDRMIYAMRYRSGFYVGESKRVTQIVGRLIGTARGSVEKERKTASLIQEKLAGNLSLYPELTRALRDLSTERILDMNEDEQIVFIHVFAEYINTVNEQRSSLSLDEKELELFPIHDEVYLDLMEYVFEQWDTGTAESFANVMTWLLLGALLRGEVVRLLYVYNSAFETFRSGSSPDTADTQDEPDEASGSMDDETYYYEGDDMDKRFPGIVWICDRCESILNEQEGFDDHQRKWKCIVCGYKNPISIQHIYDTEYAYQNKKKPVDPEKFYRALKERTDELDAEDPAGKKGQDL